ncbi:sugar phosphate isomerase/epimerase family protein [Ilumatobacter sp.]|uniref:sugar phosphate isomerase/epimerase family protein n=1 Tax=Ilumatobacter sp. TaxID=1967498 RepID=UPI0037532B62
MKIGLVTDSLADLAFEEMLDTAAELDIQGIELNTSNWSSAPHADLAGLLDSAPQRRALLKAIDSRGLELFALNANGNQLHPTDGDRQSKNLYDTITLAAELGVPTVVCMSGLPGGAPTDVTPNWITSSWPSETQAILRWQWEERLLPYWRDLTGHAEHVGLGRIAIELHGNQLVSNPPTLLRLRDEVGPIVGANFDPSHMMWMGGDPIASIDFLGSAIYHVHAKDTFINTPKVATTTRLENGPLDNLAERSWWHITLGYGHSEGWWREFCYRLRLNGYDGWLSIEHEDILIGRTEGVRRSVKLLQAVAPIEPLDYLPQNI